MALDGAQIRVTVTADVGPLTAGMQQASAAVSTSADKMAASLKTASVASTETAAEELDL